MRPPGFVVGLQSEINIAIESFETIMAVFLSDEGPDAEVLRVFEEDHSPVESVASFVGNHSAHMPGGRL